MTPRAFETSSCNPFTDERSCDLAVSTLASFDWRFDMPVSPESCDPDVGGNLQLPLTREIIVL